MSLFGRFYRVFTFGQSHAPAVGCVIQGFPSNFKVNMESIQHQLNRRRPGQSSISTPRTEKDLVHCFSGIENNTTFGTPLCFMVNNQDVKKQDYSPFQMVPRPGHADYAYYQKYGIKASSGGGRSSARETVGRVVAGALAKQFLKTKGIDFAAWVYRVSGHKIPEQINQRFIQEQMSNEEVEKGQFKDEKERQQYQSKYDWESMPQIRCPHLPTAAMIAEQIQKTKQEKDSLGGIVQGCVYGLPRGLGEPVFDKMQAVMAHAMLSIPATKGFQFGSGFQGTTMKGSQHNDPYRKDMSLKSNNSGGTLGGISTGETFEFKVAFKPVSTIGKPQKTSNLKGETVTIQGSGRHDPCVLPRAPPIVDSMAAMVVMDLWLAQQSRSGALV